MTLDLGRVLAAVRRVLTEANVISEDRPFGWALAVRGSEPPAGRSP